MKTTLAGGILAGVLTSVAMAEGDRPPGDLRPHREGDRHPHFARPEEMFKHMDRDRDGSISKREFFASPRMQGLPEEKRQAIFSRLDRDRDDLISREEIQAMRQQAERRAKEDFRKLDEDQNGSVSFDEFSKGEFISKLPEEKRRQIFGRMDTDGNGEVNGADRPKGPPRKTEMRPERKPRD